MSSLQRHEYQRLLSTADVTSNAIKAKEHEMRQTLESYLRNLPENHVLTRAFKAEDRSFWDGVPRAGIPLDPISNEIDDEVVRRLRAEGFPVDCITRLFMDFKGKEASRLTASQDCSWILRDWNDTTYQIPPHGLLIPEVIDNPQAKEHEMRQTLESYLRNLPENHVLTRAFKAEDRSFWDGVPRAGIPLDPISNEIDDEVVRRLRAEGFPVDCITRLFMDFKGKEASRLTASQDCSWILRWDSSLVSDSTMQFSVSGQWDSSLVSDSTMQFSVSGQWDSSLVSDSTMQFSVSGQCFRLCLANPVQVIRVFNDRHTVCVDDLEDIRFR
ncbi:unnamed protein product [Cyprideis torosa]|uniref:Uncharacterized protein n=1 Tax=Cyprideis torosa TaxID=163714 RepID=A0A7R8WHE9_9CRUS|nr:unnamed protein product [Cyprideis torosa]CAG0893751.1 unnamed protein product [Cyprideis torosa]